MNDLTFDELEARIREYYQQGEYRAAIDLASGSSSRFPEQSHLLYYWRSTLAARLGDSKQAIALLNEILQTGFWYGETLLRKSPSYQSLQGLPEFEALVDQNRRLREQDEHKSYPLLTIHPEGKCVGGGTPCPLLLGLHANASIAQNELEFWLAAASAGWLVAAPQSSQAMWKDAYVWDDHQIAESEILKHYRTLLSKYAIDRGHVILAGHSVGGEMAIRLALTGTIPASGFIAIGPAGPMMDDLESWEPALAEIQTSDLSGYFLVGKEDRTILHENIRAFVALLNRYGVTCELEELHGLGHSFDLEYAEGLLRGLEFLAG